MPREAQDVTDAEMGILQSLWARGGSSIRQLVTELHGERAGTAQYATVQKQLERLESKGLVRRDRSLFVHVFEAAVGREELIGRRLRDLADKLCDGSLAPILSHLARTPSLTAQERRKLRELIDSPPSPPAPGTPSSKQEKRKKQG